MNQFTREELILITTVLHSRANDLQALAEKAEAMADQLGKIQQCNDPTDPGWDVNVLREHVRHLERRIRDLHRERAALVWQADRGGEGS